MSRHLLFATSLALFSFVPTASAQTLDAETLEFVETKVRPLLEARCFECHARDSKTIQGNLLLDSHADLLKGGDSGPAVVPGKPDESLLIEAIRYEGFEMPPRSKMPAGEVEILTRWVKMGAPLPGEPSGKAVRPAAFPLKQRMADHWAWSSLKKPSVPTVKQTDWPGSDVDRFILSKLESSGLVPADTADRRTLVRRLYFDLIGLPPTIEETRAFVSNPKPDTEAIEQLVDELLASKHFGERWGRHWLDLTRYAETLGHEFDYPLHHAHEYRDYVIRALNVDVPYDQFATEHIAGDLIDDPRRHPQEGFNESLIGTGFWYLGEAKHGPVDVRGEEAAMIDNQIDVFSKTFLGLTVACARCHDHKFDAITAKDYYALSGLLQSSIRQEGMLDPGRRIETARAEMERIRAEADEILAAGMRDGLADVDEQSVRDWAAGVKDDAVRKPTHPLFLLASLATVPADAFADEFASARLTIEAARTAAVDSRKNVVQLGSFANGLPDGWSFVGEAFAPNPVTVGTEWDWRSGAARRLPAGQVHSAKTSNRFHGVLRSPVFELTHNQVAYLASAKNARMRVIVEGYRMDDFSGLLFNGARIDVKDQSESKWVRNAGDVRNHKGRRCHVEIIDDGSGYVDLDEVILTDGSVPRPAPPESLLRILAKQPASFDDLLKASVALASRGVGGEEPAATQLANAMLEYGLISATAVSGRLLKAKARLAELEKKIPGPRKVIAISDGPGEDERLSIRGNHNNLGEMVPRRLLEAFGSQSISKPFGSGRLEVAQQLFSGENPFPARVMANRIWHHLFGRGIVASTDNFGVLGKRPTHPELLDHLAVEFQNDGWSIKRMIKRLVMTQTYRMASRNEAVDSDQDPENLLLHRASIRRLQGEAIRDALLKISGRLDEKQFGPSVPVHLTAFMQGRGRPRTSGPLDGAGRRSIYLKVNRNFLSPFMLAFDTPIPFTSIGRRSNSNVPAQALILMNDPAVAEQSKVWAERLIREHADPTERVQAMYESAFSRAATTAELNRAIEFTTTVGGDGWQADVEVWKDLCHVLINTKEFIFLN
jgi:hypothetical protein